MSPSWVDHGVTAQAKWHYPLSCQILLRVETLHTLAQHSRRWGDLTQSLNACHFFPGLTHLTFTTGSLVFFSVLFSYSSALFAASASAICGIRDGFERCRKKSQEHWTVAVATLSSSDHDFQYFKNFPDTLWASRKGGKGEKNILK